MSNLMIDKELIRDLAELLKQAGLTEIEIESGGHRIRVAANVTQTVVAAPAPQAIAIDNQAPAPVAPPRDPSKHPGAVNSPMVGTVYIASQPGAAPFVRVGDAIKAGQTLLIVEAMKTMNPITAPRAGTVREVMVTDGQPVEFGEVLMIID